VATGTGFFYGRLSKPDPDITKRQYDVFLVTAKHVLDEWRAQQAAGIAKGLLLTGIIHEAGLFGLVVGNARGRVVS
jgi:hypothetical protein